ncbi:DUF1801 domain-containing protein [Arthrobacter mobilis]|uniref:DUF1801 domain-containing protein n=1 Tax=Arthrobacter mobilis TaxID=2724944 RepID=A0A7X6K570_9MICC|nr:DUF1801 domain-containing protein [Arthrobacter mobilis]NKX53108.1 DUF1801 domain-containing protein [Arthrobacter mobilis]
MAGGKPAVTPEHILTGHTPEIVDLANQLRGLVRAAAAELAETAYPVWHAIGYRHPAAGYVCGIFPYADHLKVYFEHGRFLPDPAGVLEGDGQQTRYVRIQDEDELAAKAPALADLVTAGIGFKN